MDTLWDELLREKDIVLVSYGYDWAAEKEYLAANLYGAVVKQVVGGFKKGPKEKTDPFLAVFATGQSVYFEGRTRTEYKS